MKITINEFDTLSRVALNNMQNFNVEIFDELSKKSMEILEEEITIPLKRNTVDTFVNLTFGDTFFDSSFIKYLDQTSEKTDKNSDIIATLSRKRLGEMEFAFDREKSDTFDSERKKEMDYYIKDVSAEKINKVDTIEVSKSLVETISNANIKNISFEDSIITEQFALANKLPKKFKP